jgi:CRP/FNR family transcriptional regulator, cyclic AMP receptor protein
MDAPFVPSDLAALKLFAGLPEIDLAKIHTLLRLERVDVDVLVVSQKEPTDKACVVLSGMLKVYVERPDGSDVVLALLGPGEVIGELNLIDHLGRSANVVTMEESELLWVDESVIRDNFDDMPILAENLMAILAQRLRLANAQIQALAVLSIQGRIAHQLLAFADAYGSDDGSGGLLIRPALTTNDLASMVGSDVGQVQRVLSIFMKNDYISHNDRRQYTILDKDALERLCS